MLHKGGWVANQSHNTSLTPYPARNYTKKVTSTRGGAVEARRAHNPKVVGSNPTPATKKIKGAGLYVWAFFVFLAGLRAEHYLFKLILVILKVDIPVGSAAEWLVL